MNGEEKKEKKKVNKFYGLKLKLIRLATIPLCVLGMVIMVFTYFQAYEAITAEIEINLRNIAVSAIYSYDGIYDKDYEFVQEEGKKYLLYNGSSVEQDTEYLDYLKEDSGLDITLYYYDIALLTTITDTDGNRMSGTVANKTIAREVITDGHSMFYDNARIEDTEFYAYYSPIVRGDGKCVGMIFVGKPTGEVKKNIMKNIAPVLFITLIAMLLVGMVSVSEAKKLAEVINKEKDFLGEISKGNLRATLDAGILARKDELGEMGQFTIRVQKFIRDMIERDPLTKLYTRRIGDAKLKYTRQEYIESGVPFCIAMADIDFFKKFNDTYGHDCGDLVLKSVADILMNSLFGHGYAVRWGGEEFIIVLENTSLDDGVKLLNKIKDLVCKSCVFYDELRLSITMTFGIMAGSGESINELLKEVDTLLYQGKENGRNQIVVKRD